MSAAASPEDEPLDINQFVATHGRLPQLGRDPVAPWKYRGWLLYYVQLGVREKAPEVIDRWHWHLEALELGRLPDAPIPQMDFSHEGRMVDEGSAGHKAVEKWVELAEDEGGWSGAFRALLDWLLWGLALSREYPRLGEPTQEKLYRGVDLEPVLKHPYDYLGGYYQSTKTSRWNRTGYYCTPHNVCEMMARMLFEGGQAPEEGRDPRTLSVCDPAVGSGRMLLHASNYSVCLFGQDIDPICCAMAKINGAWYAPWLAFPFPRRILGFRPAPPPPEPLPVEEDGFTLTPPGERPRRGSSPSGRKVYRIDDPAQGRLF